MVGYIYLTTNLVNDKKYIGQHTSNSFDTKYLGSGTELIYAIKKYGKENFSCKVLCECDSQEELDEKERHYIDLYNACESDMFYNICRGGKMCQLLYHTEQTKEKISVANRGKKRTIEQNERNSAAKLGSRWMHKDGVQTLVVKKNIESFLEDGWEFGTLGNRKSSPATEERKQNIRKSLLGKKKSQSHIDNHAKSLRDKVYHWYTDGKSCILVSDCDEVPYGYKRGRLVSQESIDKNRLSHIGKTPWNKGKHLK